MTTPPPPSPQALTGQQLPPELAAYLQDKLQPDELLIWTGQPTPKLYGRRGWFFVPFGIILLVVATAVCLGALNKGNAFLLCPIPVFLVAGGAMALMPMVFRRIIAAKIFYAITNHRIIVVKWSSFESYSTERLETMFRIDRGYGAGDLQFSIKNPHTYIVLVEFLDVPNVRAVEELLRATVFPPKE